MVDYPPDRISRGREATIADVIETIETEHPETKEQLAALVGLSPNYLTEVLRELEDREMITKAYVVNNEAVFASAGDVSAFWTETDGNAPTGIELLDMLRGLDEGAFDQYRAARAAFGGESPDPAADHLEPLTNERYSAVLAELKSFRIATDWPGNRVLAALASIAKDLEMAGDRACFIANAVARTDEVPNGVVTERVVDVFEAGERIHGLVRNVLLDGELELIDDLHAQERAVHRDLTELLELVTAYDPDTYGYLVTVTRALERIIHYWVNAAEIAVRIHSGIDPGHVEI